MKSLSLLALAIFFFAIFSAQAALAAEPSAEPSGSLLNELTDLARQCVVQPYFYDATGKRVLLPLKSVCPELRPDDSAGNSAGNSMDALIELHGETYRAGLVESEDSDGGDLDHLTILDSRGQVVATRSNIPAFNNVLIALTGGGMDLPEHQAR